MLIDFFLHLRQAKLPVRAVARRVRDQPPRDCQQSQNPHAGQQQDHALGRGKPPAAAVGGPGRRIPTFRPRRKTS